MDFSSGTILKKRYVIKKEIGRGGMAVVYLAHDNILDRDVALKLLNTKLSQNLKKMQEFQNEVKLATKVRDEHVVEVYDIFTENDQYCIVFELVNGYSLKRLIARSAPLDNTEAIKVMEDIIRGVQAIHKANIVHRDLKPSNILLGLDGTIKIVDFGISIISGSINDSDITDKKIIGTMKYISSEIIQGERPTIQSDIYSLGIIFFELLVGYAPFRHQNARKLATQHVLQAIPNPRTYNNKISQAVENIVLKATAKDPGERYKNLEELYDDLREALTDKRSNDKRIKLKNRIYIASNRNGIRKLFARPKIFGQTVPFYYRAAWVWIGWAAIIIVVILVLVAVLVAGS